MRESKLELYNSWRAHPVTTHNELGLQLADVPVADIGGATKLKPRKKVVLIGAFADHARLYS